MGQNVVPCSRLYGCKPEDFLFSASAILQPDCQCYIRDNIEWVLS